MDKEQEKGRAMADSNSKLHHKYQALLVKYQEMLKNLREMSPNSREKNTKIYVREGGVSMRNLL